MTEYISKADILEVVRKGANVYKSLGMINKLPTIDIVHCSECIHAELNWADGEYYCEILQYDFAKDYYCADGRRTDD